MTWKHIFTSSIGKKFTMGFTGLFLISFLVVHCVLNSLVFFPDNGEQFNDWAHFMGSNWIVRALEIGLFAGIILHIVQGLVLYSQNKAKRPIGYAVKPKSGQQTSTWYSRSMTLLGTLILIFLIIHLYHFWVPSRFGDALGGSMGVTQLEEASLSNGKVVHNLYAEMLVVFQHGWVVVLYCLAMVSLAYHLLHGFQSAFQTFGINHKKYTPIIKAMGAGFSIIVSLIFALMPIVLYMRGMQ